MNRYYSLASPDTGLIITITDVTGGDTGSFKRAGQADLFAFALFSP